MFSYTRKDQTNKKPVAQPTPAPTKPSTPIKMKVNMPAGMQPIPPPMMETQPDGICIYPSKPEKPAPPVMKPNTPPVVPPIAPLPIMPPQQPGMQCFVCGNMGLQPHMPCPICGNMGTNPPMPPPNWGCMNDETQMSDSAKCYNDMEVVYLKKMYPPVCQKIQMYIDSELNQYDHDLSPIYEMYPAEEGITHMVNCVYNNMKGDLPNLIKDFECNRDTRAPMGGSFYTLIYALLINELYRKRMRRRFYPTYSSPFYGY